MKLHKQLKKAQFEKVYSALEKTGFVYTISNIYAVFPYCDLFHLYTFLMYSLSRKETVAKHIAICECLIYSNIFISDVYNMIYWHILKAIVLEDAEHAMSWAIELFGANPSSPFSDTELTSFAHHILKIDPNNKNAMDYLSWKRKP